MRMLASPFIRCILSSAPIEDLPCCSLRSGFYSRFAWSLAAVYTSPRPLLLQPLLKPNPPFHIVGLCGFPDTTNGAAESMFGYLDAGPAHRPGKNGFRGTGKKPLAVIAGWKDIGPLLAHQASLFHHRLIKNHRDDVKAQAPT